MNDSQQRSIVIRADASTDMGTGHLMRCLALGQAWKDAGGRVCFITCCDSEELLRRLRAEDFEVRQMPRRHPDSGDWDSMGEGLEAHPGAWGVLDGYHFDEGYQQKVKACGHRLLVIDDMAHLKHYYADVVLNQNLNADRLFYSREPCTTLLLGTRYVLLRREFVRWIRWRRETREIGRRILVTLGGSDPRDYTQMVISSLKSVRVPDLEATVVVGAGNPHVGALQTACEESGLCIRMLRNAQNMPELMAWADAAVAGGGTTIWELLFLQTPTLALVSAENQRSNAEELDALRLARTLTMEGDGSSRNLAEALVSLLEDLAFRSSVPESARHLVDGQGVRRLLTIMTNGEDAVLGLREASSADCRTVWGWANDPEVREASFSTRPIPWDEHSEWFEARLQDPQCLFYMILDRAGNTVGNVRFQLSHDEAEISIVIASDLRSQGLGGVAIRLASMRLFLREPITRIRARIKEGNVASRCAFSKAGYKDVGVIDVGGVMAKEMAISREDVRA